MRSGKRLRPPALVALSGLWLAAACAPPPEPGLEPERDPEVETPGPEPAPVPKEEEAEARPGGELGVVGALPPIRRVSGPLALHVQYPRRSQRIGVRDSNFVFGSVGTGDATLEIDGHRVPVEPNGAFLAFLPVPEPSGDTAVYRFVARSGERVDSLRHPVRLPPLPYFGSPGDVWLDTTALRPEEERWALPEEPVELAVRGAPALEVWTVVGGERFPLEEGPDPAAERWGAWLPEPGSAGPARDSAGVEPDSAAPTRDSAVLEAGPPPSSRYTARIPADSLAAAAGASARRPVRVVPEAAAPGAGPLDAPAWKSAEGLATPDTLALELVATADGDTVRLERSFPLLVLHPNDLPVVALREAPDSVHGTSGVVPGRPTPYGPYRWLFAPGGRGLVEGRRDDRLRLRLAPHETSWVAAEDAELLPAGTAAPFARVGDLRVEPREDRLALDLPLDVALPIRVTELDERTLRLTLYGAEGETDRVSYGETDPLLEQVAWEQASDGIYRVELRLREPIWGYRAAYVSDERAGATLRLEIRRPPRIDGDRPLEGRRIAVDPGHPPAGAHGPTGYYEGHANLAVARRLVEMLRREGAEPVLVRTDTLPMGLYERTERAVDVGAELFVSIHNNALPDGVRPFGREGTSAYYYHPHSRPLAETIQAGMLAEMELRDLGIFWGDLAVARASWMPSVLTEGAFMMIPRHEAALRDREFQARYARGVLRGIRAFLADRARARRD